MGWGWRGEVGISNLLYIVNYRIGKEWSHHCASIHHIRHWVVSAARLVLRYKVVEKIHWSKEK